MVVGRFDDDLELRPGVDLDPLRRFEQLHLRRLVGDGAHSIFDDRHASRLCRSERVRVRAITSIRHWRDASGTRLITRTAGQASSGTRRNLLP
jgi:hypothetical protein